MFRVVFFLSFLLFLNACGAAVRSPAYDPSTRFEAERVKLAKLKEEREAWQLAAKLAEERATFEECRVNLRELHVAVKNRLISCQEEHARESECQAAKAKRSAEGMAIGCLLGLLFPPVGVLGCLGGGGLGALGDKCVEPSCQSDPDVVLRNVLTEQHLDALPECKEPARAASAFAPSLHD